MVLSRWAFKRKLLIDTALVLFFFACIALVITIVIYEPPSCSDGEQNQDEKGVDCGGVCEAICQFEINRPEIRWTRLFKVEDQYETITYSVNPNPKLEAFAEYEVTLYDEDGIPITSRIGMVHLPPHLTTSVIPIYEKNLTEGITGVPVRAFFKFIEPIRWRRVEVVPTDAVPLTINDIVLITEGDTPRATATVENRTLSHIDNTTYYATIFDERKNAVASTTTYTRSIPPRGEQSLTFRWSTPVMGTTSLCRLGTQTLILARAQTSEEEKWVAQTLRHFLERIPEEENVFVIVENSEGVSSTQGFVSADQFSTIFRKEQEDITARQLIRTLIQGDEEKLLFIALGSPTLLEDEYVNSLIDTTSVSLVSPPHVVLYDEQRQNDYEVFKPLNNVTYIQTALPSIIETISAALNSGECIARPVSLEILPVIDEMQ